MKGETIKIFNNGDMYRDFTYVDDIVQGIVNLLEHPPKADAAGDRHKVYNLGNNKPETSIEEGLGKFVEWYMRYYRVEK